jgi:hypothetical protein
MHKQFSLTSTLRTVATVVTLLVVFSTLVAGVIDTRSRVGVLERDCGVLTGHLDRLDARQERQFADIKEALEVLKVGQAVLRQRMDDYLNGRR